MVSRASPRERQSLHGQWRGQAAVLLGWGQVLGGGARRHPAVGSLLQLRRWEGEVAAGRVLEARGRGLPVATVVASPEAAAEIII